MKQVYNYDSVKYGMLKAAIDRGSEISNVNNPMYANGQLTELGRIAQEAFQGAYNADPAEFSALQDAYAYNSYYAVTEAWLKSALGIDISGRADCVKGMVWSITNMCGTGGCQDFFRWANLSNSMTDREFVTALSNSVVNNVATKYASQPQYHEGWKNRYRNELKDCLVYIAEDEAAAATPVEPVQPEPTPAPTPGPSMAPAAPAAPTPGTDDGAGDDNDTDAPSTDAGSDDAGNGGAASGDAASGDSSTSGSDGATNGTTSGSTDADASNGAGDSSAGAGSSNGSDSDVSGDGSNEGSDAADSSTENKPSTGEQLGSMLGSSLMAGINGGSSSDERASGQGSGSNADGASDASAGAGAKQSDADAQKAGDKGSTTTTTKTSGGNMPKTGDLIVMASLASASLATLGATSIVSGKHKLDQQNKTAGEDGSEE